MASNLKNVRPMRCKNRRPLTVVFLAAIVSALAGTSCGGGAFRVAAAPAPVVTPVVKASPAPGTFTEINQSIIQPRCISCHSAAAPSDGVNLSTYAGVLAQVTPANPAQSILYTQVQSGAMPKGGPSLSDAQIQDVYNWIEAGAQNN
jgi:mono/diheme cytochrome c family protein